MCRRLTIVWMAALLSGCTLITEWRGDPAFLINGTNNGTNGAVDPLAAWETGETTMPEVIGVLGPPDEILRQGHELWFVYRYKYEKARELRIVAFSAQFFGWYDGKNIDSLVVVAFDEDDRLHYVGRGKYAGDRGILELLLE